MRHCLLSLTTTVADLLCRFVPVSAIRRSGLQQVVHPAGRLDNMIGRYLGRLGVRPDAGQDAGFDEQAERFVGRLVKNLLFLR